MACRRCRWKVAVCAIFASSLSSLRSMVVGGVVTLVAFVAIVAMAVAPPVAAEDARPKWSGYLDVLGFPGADGTLHRSDLFIPLMQGEAALSYLNLRNEVDDEGFAGFSVGLGLRYQVQDWIIGSYGFIDWRETDHSGEYLQYSGGIELLSEAWDLRINGYMPEEQTSRIVEIGAVDVDIENDQIFYFFAEGQRNLPGFDAEVGARLGHWDNLDWKEAAFLAPGSMQVWAHVGGYGYLGDEGFDDVTGVRGRLEFGFDDLAFAGRGSRLTLGVEARYDDVREQEFAARLRLRIPFGVFSGGGGDDGSGDDLALGPLDRRMTDSVVRWPAEVLAEGHETGPAYNPGGQAYDRYLEAGSPEELAMLLEGRQSEDEVLFINMRGEAGDWDLTDFETAGNGITYALAGKPAPVFYDDPYGGGRLRFDYTPKGATPKLLFDEATAAVTDKTFVFKPGDHINGWEIDATGYEHGISIADAGVYYITNSDISGASNPGLRAVGSGVADLHLHIWDSKLHHNKDGLQLGGGAQVIAADSHFDSNQGKGVVVSGVESWFNMIGGSASHNESNGITVIGFGSIDVEGVTIFGNERNGISMYNPSSAEDDNPTKGIKVRHSNISHNAGDGIQQLSSEAGNHVLGIEIINNSINDNGSHGIELRNTLGTISDNIIFNNVHSGIEFGISSNDQIEGSMTLYDNRIYNNGSYGIKIRNSNVNNGKIDFEIAYSNFDNNYFGGIYLSGPGGKVEHNVIRNNGEAVTDGLDYFSRGYGIYIFNSGARDGFEISDNVFEGNVRGDCGGWCP